MLPVSVVGTSNRFRRHLTASVVAAWLIPAAAASSEEHALDTTRSTITLHVAKSGLFRAFADNHVIQAPVTSGSMDDGPAARVQLVIDTARLRVVDPGLPPSDRDKVQTRMLGPEVLDVSRFPQIRFQSTAVDQVKPGAWVVTGTLTLHGETHVVKLTVTTAQGRYKAATSLKQTDYGITPISIAGGAVTVKDEVQVDADIVEGPASAPAQSSRDRLGDLPRGARVGMHVPRQPPVSADRHEHVRDLRVVEDPSAQRRLELVFGTELRHEDDRRRVPGLRQIDRRVEDCAGHRDAAIDRPLAAERHEQLGQREDTRTRLGRHPREIRPEMRPVLIEVSTEERWHEERDHRGRLTKSRQFPLEPQVGLVAAVAVNGEVGGLDAQHLPDLGRDAVVPGQAFAEHH
jgi:polyisoprenoid-binding protein YceI